MLKLIKKISVMLLFSILILPKTAYAVTFDFTIESNSSLNSVTTSFNTDAMGAKIDPSDLTIPPIAKPTTETHPPADPEPYVPPGDGGGEPVVICNPNEEICGPKLGPVTQQYMCHASTSTYKKIVIMMNFYDMTKRDVLNEDLLFQANAKFKSGTWIGALTAEHRYGNWEVKNAHVTEVKNEWTCLWEYCEYNEETETTECKRTTTEELTTYGETTDTTTADSVCKAPDFCSEDNITCSFIEGQITGHVEVPTENEEFLKECINDEANALISQISSFISTSSTKVMYITNNIYPKDKSNIELKSLSVSELADSFECPEQGTPENPVTSGECWNTWTKYPKNVCINRVTGEVSYDKDSDCTKEEFDVSGWRTEREYEKTKFDAFVWRYFIPLNTKTVEGDWYLRIISADGGFLTPPFCYSAMVNYPDSYTNHIIRLNDSEFIGTDGEGKSHIEEDIKTAQEDGGCKIAIKFEFPVIQEFYNEVVNDKGGKNLKGYGFYYRQIDVNNPFPNGIDTHSYWHSWNAKNKSDRIPDIQKSFDEMTYHTSESYNHKNIKNYNSDKEYASWKDMNVDGTSNFIKGNDYVVNDETSSFYQLGCGPSNADWEDCK